MSEADFQEIEQYFQCPYCWQQISMVIDPSAGNQSYIEDCEICCRPIRISYATDDAGNITALEPSTLDE